MIIFTLDALADDSHRRHFIDPKKAILKDNTTVGFDVRGNFRLQEKKDQSTWKPDYEAYNAACGGDKPVDQIVSIWGKEISLGGMGIHQIWTSRCESVKDITLDWLDKHLFCFEHSQLKMRPIGDDSPQQELFEKWLHEFQNLPLMDVANCPNANNIEMAFSSHKSTIEMFRRRGIFVFDCNQGKL